MELALMLTYHQCTTNGVGWYAGRVGYKIHYAVGCYVDVPLTGYCPKKEISEKGNFRKRKFPKKEITQNGNIPKW